MKGSIRLPDIPKVVFLYTMRYAIPLLPRQLRMGVARIIGSLTATSWRARCISDELTRLMGPDEMPRERADEIGRYALALSRMDLFDTWSFPRLNKKNIDTFSELERGKNLEQVLADGKGAILAVCHYGLYKALLPALGYRGYPVAQIGANPMDWADEESSLVNNVCMKIEADCENSLPVEFIYVGGFPRAIFRILKSNQLLVVSMDGVVDPERTEVPFFRGSILLSKSAGRISRKTGAPIVPVFCIRDRGRHRIVFDEPFAVDMDDETIARQYAETMERYIRRHPDQYAWFLLKNRTHPPEIGRVISVS